MKKKIPLEFCEYFWEKLNEAWNQMEMISPFQQLQQKQKNKVKVMEYTSSLMEI